MPSLRFLRIWLFLCVVVTQPVLADVYRDYWRTAGEAMKASRMGHWDEAYSSWQKTQQLVPESPYPCYEAARCAARLRRRDEALTWLSKAADAGYESPELASACEDLASIRDDPRWQPILDRMQASRDEDTALWNALRAEPDPASAPTFKSFKKLARSFDPRFDELESSFWRAVPIRYSKAILQLTDERIGADRRYLLDHPQADDREAATWDVLATLRRVRRPEWMVRPPSPNVSAPITAAVDTFLHDYPKSAHRPEALTIRALAVFGARSEGGTKDKPWNDDDLKTLRASLAAITRAFPETTDGGLALARNLILADWECVGPVTPEMRTMRTELETVYASNGKVQRFLDVEGRSATLRIDGLGQFEGVDLAGRRWDAASFSGKVTLIDFWATWCGPCVAEIPNLRKAWSELHDRGLQIVGVSLDMDDRKSFEGWLRTNEVGWPQIWDGKGWSSGLARKFDIHSIPAPVLIDANGRVDTVDLRGDALIARIRELLPKD